MECYKLREIGECTVYLSTWFAGQGKPCFFVTVGGEDEEGFDNGYLHQDGTVRQHCGDCWFRFIGDAEKAAEAYQAKQAEQAEQAEQAACKLTMKIDTAAALAWPQGDRAYVAKELRAFANAIEAGEGPIV